MALIKCSECGKEVSDKALKCPHCGSEKENITRNETFKKVGLVSTILLILIFLALLIAPMFYLLNYHLILFTCLILSIVTCFCLFKVK